MLPRFPSPRALRAHALSLAVIASFVAPRVAHANDSSVGGSGQDLIPERSSSVTMVSEDIRLECVDELASEWRIEATYVFENRSDAEVTLAMGFPEHRCDPERDDDCNGSGAFRDMHTTVRGVEVEHRIGAVGRDSPWYTELGRTFVYDVTFAPHERLTVVHRYAMHGDLSVYGFGVRYVTRTGTLWNGPIERAVFTIVLPAAPAGLREKPSYPLARRGATRTASGSRYELVYEHTHWTPERDFAFQAFNLQTITMAYGCPDPEDARFDPFSDADLDRCRNLPYARHGMPFRSRALRRAFYRGAPTLFDDAIRLVPFAPSEGFSPELLTLADHAYVARLVAEKTRRAERTRSASDDRVRRR